MKKNFVTPLPKIETVEPEEIVVPVEEASIDLPDVEPGRVAFLVALSTAILLTWRGEIPFTGAWLAVVGFAWLFGFVGALVYVAIADLKQRPNKRYAMRSEVKKRK